MPALAAIPEIEITAVGTSREESAASSAKAFNIPAGYGNIADLLASPLDLVAVSVKAPDHIKPALAVLDAGKHLFIEWPMGANFNQAQQIEERARQRGVRGFVGLQARAAPPLRHAIELVRDGYVGRLYSVSTFGAYSYWGEQITASYSADIESGANVLTIPGGHSLDAMRALVGEVTSVNGRTTHLREHVMAADVGREVRMTAPDQFAAIGTLESGAVFSAHFTGVAPRGEMFRMMLVGDKGELLIEADGMPEIAPLRLSGTRARGEALKPIAVPSPEGTPPQGPAYNIWFLWRQIAADLGQGTTTAPDLASALKTRGLIDAIARSAAEGGRTIEL
jgi:predicted dehydrogenase